MKTFNLFNSNKSTNQSGVRSARTHLPRLAAIFTFLLTLGVGQMWALDIYLDISACTGWTNDGATIKVWPGTGSDITGSSIATNLYKFTVTSATGTMYFKRMNGSSTWNEASVTYNSSYNLYKLTDWNAAACSNANINNVTKTDYIYFDNSTTAWSNSNRYFIIGHDYPSTYSKKYSMTAIGHTKLWYVANSSDSWTDATYYGVINPTSAWGSDTNWGSSNLSNGNKYTAAYTAKRDLNSGKTVLFTPGSASNGCALTISSDMSSYTGFNYSQTVKKYTCTAEDDGSMASQFKNNTSANSGTVTISAYKMTGNGTASNSSNSATLDEASETSASVDAAYTGEVTLTASANTGYTFVGWFTNTTATTALSTNTSYTYNAPKSTKTVYARFKEDRYTVKVQTYTNGDATPKSNTYGGIATGVALTATPNTGYQFNGWTINSGSGTFGSTSTASTNFYPTSNSQLKANFTTKTITVTLNGNGGSDGSATIKYAASSLTNISHSSRSGYSLNGYYTADSGGDKVINTDGSLNNVSGWVSGGYWSKATDGTLYAQWTENAVYYAVNFDVHSSGNGSLTAANTSTSAAITSGNTVLSGTGVTFTASPSTGYEVEGWYSNSDCSSAIAGAGTGTTYSTTISAATTVYVKFKEQTWSVAFAAGTGGTVTTPNSTPRTVGQLTGISIAATPATGYTFNTWTITSGSGSFTSAATTNSNTFKPTAASTVTASFTPITYTISYTLNGGTNYAGAPTSYNVTTATIVLGTPTKSHYHFDGWTDGNGDPITSIPLGSTGDITLTANWTKLPMVYLKNTMNWANAYVSFYTGNYWEENTSTGGSGSYRTSEFYVADPAAMTYNSANGLFEYECPDLYAYTYACFTKDKQDNYGNFYQTEGIYCNNTMQYDKMVNVAAITSSTYNQTKYYTSFTFDTKADGTGWFFPGGWSSWETKGNEGSWNSTNIRWTKSLAANTSYEFKVYNHGVYYGNSGTYSASGSKTFTSGGSNCTLSTTLAGTYTFDYNTSTNSLTISYPAIYAISGGFNSWTEETNLDFTGNDGTYSVSITANNSNYEFKVLENGVWYGHSDKTFTGTESNVTLATSSNNIKLKADIYPSGTYTFAYNKSTHKLGVTYPSGHVVNYGVGDHAGTASVTMSPNIASGKKILDSQSLTFSKGSTATGYTWKGWYSNADGTGTLHSSTDGDYTKSSRSGDFSVYACYNVVNYTITYNLNGGSNPGGAPTGFTIESAAITLPTPTKTGYTFNGWYENADLSTGGVKTTIPAGSTGNKVYYAKWTPITYTIHFNGNGNTSGSMSNQTGVTYDAATTITANAFVKTGYNFAGWGTTQERANAGTIDRTDGAAHGNLTSTQGATAQLWAVWTPKQSALTLDKQTSATGYGSAGTAAASAAATYGSAMPALTGTLPTAAEGYAFMGFYDATGGAGTQYYDGTGASVTNWDKDKTTGTTLYAYYKQAEITSVTFASAIVEPGATVTATANIDPTPNGTTIVCWRLLHDNGNEYSPQPIFSAVSGTSVSFKAPETSTHYKVEAKLRTGSSCDGGTLLDTETGRFQVAGSHTVTVNYKCGDDVIKAATSVTATPLDWTEEFTAPNIFGYTFARWDATDGVTIKNGDSDPVTTTTNATIQIQATYNGKLTAVYTQKSMIFFKNTLGWEDVYVNFYDDSYWNNPKGSGNKNVTNRNKHMTQIDDTDIWYYDYGAASISPSLYVSFTSASQDGYEFFWHNDGVNVVYPANYADNIHSDRAAENGFKAATPMFVPLAAQEPVLLNEKAKYYNAGYWTQYTSGTGYRLEIYNEAGNSMIKYKDFESADDLMPMKAVLDLEGGQTYKFQIRRGGESSAGIYYGNSGTMDYTNHGQDVAWDLTNYPSISMVGITTNAAGDYTFNLSYSGHAVENPHYRLRIAVDYPVASGDYRVIYKDAVHTNWHPSAIVSKANNRKDTVSFFVRPSSSPEMKIQTATVDPSTGAVTWGSDVAIPTATLIGLASTDVYNFNLSMNGSGVISLESVDTYTGNFYIRTDAANSKWDNYRSDPDHLMVYSEYSIEHGGYTHYHAHWVNKDDVGRKNVKFVIANDYSPCISDTLTRETAEDTWENIASFITEGGDLLRSANVRFMWDKRDNSISRAYVDGAQGDYSTNFLYMLNVEDGDDKIREENEDPLTDHKVTFKDNGNWMYEADIQAQPTAQIKLLSNWGTENTITQYFRGASDDTETLIGGSGSNWYDIRLIYDFKTNRLIAGLIPSGTIDEQMAIHADVMFIREHQGDIAQLTFAEKDSKMGAITDIETAFGVLRFNKWTINNKSKADGHAPLSPLLSRFERDIFYVSFPFKVSMEEVFGFGTYGQHWIIEYYDGASRAANGYWQESGPNWKFVTNRKNKFFEPGIGYIIALDLDELGESSSVWANTEQVELYFPSYGKMDNITSSTATYEIPSHLCTIDRSNESNGRGGTLGPDYDRRVKDSHWNVLGVPTYVNPDAPNFANTDWITEATETSIGPNFLYEWNMDDNSVSAVSASGYTYHAMHAYLVQYCGDVTWTSSVSVSPTLAPRRNSEYRGDYEFRIEMLQNNVAVDQTFVKLSDNEAVTTGFEFNYDLSKEFNKNKANIYTLIGTEQVAGNVLPLTEQTTLVPVGVTIAENGEYTFALPEGASGIGVTLIDNEMGIRTPLNALDYSVALNAGTYNERFVLEISPIKQTPTEIENSEIREQQSEVRKVMIDGLLYIVKDGKMFDARGSRVE